MKPDFIKAYEILKKFLDDSEEEELTRCVKEAKEMEKAKEGGDKKYY